MGRSSAIDVAPPTGGGVITSAVLIQIWTTDNVRIKTLS